MIDSFIDFQSQFNQVPIFLVWRGIINIHVDTLYIIIIALVFTAIKLTRQLQREWVLHPHDPHVAPPGFGSSSRHPLEIDRPG